MIWIGEPALGVLHRGHVGEAADAAGDVARRRALQRGDDADDVACRPAGVMWMTLSALGVDLADGRPGRLGDHLAEDPVAGDDHEADGVDRRGGARGQDRALHAPLAAVGQEGADVGEAAELGLVDGRLGAGRQRRADLGDDQADVVGRHLHPGVALDLEDRPQLEAQARHQQVGLVAGLAVQGDELVALRACAPRRLVTSPTSAGPIEWKLRSTTTARRAGRRPPRWPR